MKCRIHPGGIISRWVCCHRLAPAERQIIGPCRAIWSARSPSPPIFHYPRFLNRLLRPATRARKRILSGSCPYPVLGVIEPPRGNLTYNTDTWAEKEDPLPLLELPSEDPREDAAGYRRGCFVGFPHNVHWREFPLACNQKSPLDVPKRQWVRWKSRNHGAQEELNSENTWNYVFSSCVLSLPVSLPRFLLKSLYPVAFLSGNFVHDDAICEPRRNPFAMHRRARRDLFDYCWPVLQQLRRNQV